MYTDTKPADTVSEVMKKDIKVNRLTRSKRNDLLHYVQEYCTKAGIHGIQYIGEENRTTSERVWWILFLIGSISACIYVIIQIYLKWLQSPVLVSFATQQTPFYDVPFPAITICPKAKIDLFRPECFNLPNYMQKKQNNQTTTSYEERYAAYMHVLCEEELSDSTNKTIDYEAFYKYITNCAPKRMAKIVFMNEYFVYNFDDLFKPMMTEEGICYTFNRLRLDEMFTEKTVRHNHNFSDFPSSEWHSETGYDKGAGIYAYPRRGLLQDIRFGLGVFLFEDKRNKDYYCDPVMQGYTVSLHIPSRPAKTREDFFFVPYDAAVLAPIRAKVTLTSETIKSYSPLKRNCYFPSEKRLVYFRQYTQANCFIECLAEHLLRKCGCVKFYMPRNSTTPVCGPASTNCTDEFELEQRIESLKVKLAMEEGQTPPKATLDTCDCLPMCNDIAYSTEPVDFDVNDEQILAWMTRLKVVEPEMSANPNMMTTYIMLYLKDRYIETTDRNELYGPQDFLSNFGGLLGLFTGFSMLSLIEIIYFLTLRLCANVKIYGHWAGVVADK